MAEDRASVHGQLKYRWPDLGHLGQAQAWFLRMASLFADHQLVMGRIHQGDVMAAGLFIVAAFGSRMGQ